MKKKLIASKSKKRDSNVRAWLESETSHKQAALENASRHFDDKDALTVNTLEAIYGQESSFGKNRRKRGMAGAAGDFQLERQTARRMGLTVSEKNDERFDVDNSSAASAKYLIESAGATPAKSIEVQEYVDKVLRFDAEFSKKSKADKTVKSGSPRKIKKLPDGGHWITLDGKHIFIQEK